MDKKFLKRFKLDEDVSRFNKILNYKTPAQSRSQINEYTFITTPQLNEDDDEELGDEPDAKTKDKEGGDKDFDMELDSNNSDVENNDLTNQDQGDLEGGDGFDVNDKEGEDVEQTDGKTTDEETTETEPFEEGDEVVDIDDLTQTQEAIDFKMDNVDKRLTDIISTLNSFKDMIVNNDEKINNLQQEIEKRNPTEEEKISKRIKKSAPFNETPDEFTKRFSEENEEPLYTITTDDVKTINPKALSNSFSHKEKLTDYLNF